MHGGCWQLKKKKKKKNSDGERVNTMDTRPTGDNIFGLFVTKRKMEYE